MGIALAQSRPTHTSHIFGSMPLCLSCTHCIDCRTLLATPHPSGCAPAVSDCVPPTQQGRPVAVWCLCPRPLHTHQACSGGSPSQTGTNHHRTMFLMLRKAMQVGRRPSPSRSTRLSLRILGLPLGLRRSDLHGRSGMAPRSRSGVRTAGG